MTTTPPSPERPIWLIPFVVAAALFMENLDASAIATALPVIARDLGEDPVILKLALTSYLIALAVFIPVSGWCADRFGARVVFQAAIVVFVVASVSCGAAQSLEQLVIARALQGVGGAMMVPVGRLILLRAVPKERLVEALAYLTIPALIAPTVGPPLSGLITTMLDWRWIFWINVPVGVVGFALAARYMENVRALEHDRLDWLGFLFAGTALSTLIFGFTIMGRDFVPLWVAPGLIAIGAASATAYIVHARRTPRPLLDLKLFAIPTFATSVLGGGLFRLGIGAIPFLLPLMLQDGFGLTALESGLVTFTAAFGAVLMKFAARPILKRFGFRQVLTVNAIICGALLAIHALFTPATPWLLISTVLFVGGVFRSLQFTALNAIAYADVDEAKMSTATATIAVAQQFFLSAGVAVAAFALEAARASRSGAALAPQDFSTAFLVIAAITVVAAFLHARLSDDAGAKVSGRAAIAS